MQHALPSQQTIGGMLKSPRLLIFAGVVALFAFLTAWYTHTDPEALGHFSVRSAREAWQFAMATYLKMNPRIGEMCIYLCDFAIPFHILGPILFTIFLLVSTVAIFRLGVGHLPDDTWRSIITLSFIFVATLGFHSGVFWFLANFSWFYASILAVCFVISVEPWFRGEFKLSWGRCVLAMPLAFISGMSQENTPATLIVILSGCGIYWFMFRKLRRGIWQYLLIMSVLIAAAYLLYTAPARSCRAENANWDFSFECILFRSLLSPSNWIYFLICFWRPFAVGGLLVFLSFLSKRNLVPSGRTKLLIASYFLLLSVLTLAPCWGAPRGYMPMDIVLLCILGRQVYQLLPELDTQKKIMVCTTQILLTATLTVPHFISLYATHRQWQHIVNRAEECKQQGKSILVLRSQEFDLAPVTIHRLPIPKLVFAREIRPFVPLCTISWEQFEKFVDSWGVSHAWDLGDLPQVRANKSVAKHLGLESIFYIRD
ncbi:MAG: DUF6056 family protein [Akkermansia muciniphila]|nr:DUF6056 family protein [Akkermansia muciniphila]